MSANPSKPEILAPTRCQTMAEVRAGVDDVDRALVTLLQTRFDYMDAAARIKPTRDAVRDEGRKAQVIANVRADAVARRLPEELLTQIWDVLVEGSIAYELERWDKTRG